MNSQEKGFLTQAFKEIDARLNRIEGKIDLHTIKITRIETKWNMTTKFLAVISGLTALIISSLIKILWR